MSRASATLTIGAPAPGFALPAANRAGTFSLSDLARPAILEFVRGTW